MWETLLHMDGLLLLWIQEHLRNDFLTAAMRFITHLGDRSLIWALLALFFLMQKKTERTGALMALSLLASQIAVNQVLKNLVMRPRPFEAMEGLAALVGAKGYSFPSGHTGSAFAAAAVMFFTLPKRVGIPALLFASLIGFSRMYLGVHYPSDVLAGAVAGTLLAAAVCGLFPEKKRGVA